MSSVVFLLLALGLSVLGTIVLFMLNRRPTGIESGVDEFHREMRALAPEERRRTIGRVSPRPGDEDDRAGG